MCLLPWTGQRGQSAPLTRFSPWRSPLHLHSLGYAMVAVAHFGAKGILRTTSARLRGQSLTHNRLAPHSAIHVSVGLRAVEDGRFTSVHLTNHHLPPHLAVAPTVSPLAAGRQLHVVHAHETTPGRAATATARLVTAVSSHVKDLHDITVIAGSGPWTETHFHFRAPHARGNFVGDRTCRGTNATLNNIRTLRCPSLGTASPLGWQF